MRKSTALIGFFWALSPAARADTHLAAPRATRPVILDAGHGGKDLGAVRKGKTEKDIALQVAKRLQERLEKDGVPVKLTRDSDVYVPLDARIQDSVSWDGAVFLSLHLNEDRNKSADGMEVYAFGRATKKLPGRHHRGLPPLPAPPKAARVASAELAKTLVGALRAKGFKVEQPDKASFYVLKNPSVPSVLVELGYISNPAEAKRLVDAEYQDKIVDALAASLKDYLARTAALPAAIAAKAK